VRRLLLLLAVTGASLWLAPGAFAAGWCGSGESNVDRADIVTGRQVHTVVVVPADGADSFATESGLLADDVASLQVWWTGQDPTRVPRFDDAVFAGQTCLDISFLRLAEPGASLTGASLTLERIITELSVAGLGSQYKKYLVYYDGPAPQAGVCGIGEGSFADGPAYAVVLLAGCPGVPNDSIATHELLHALGAVPLGAPHACPGDLAHPCDSPTDVLNPTTAGEPLSQKVLDFNHDDYYGHSGSWPDIQDSLWLRHLDAPQFPLVATLTGAGTVTSDVPGVDCTVMCTTQWDQGSQVVLTAEPTSTNRFVGWKGVCKGLFTCALTISQPDSVAAVFGPLRIPLRVRITGQGRIVCSPGCPKTLTAGRPLSLRAIPAKGWRFSGWSGACKGRQAACAPATDFALAIHATFRRRAT